MQGKTETCRKPASTPMRSLLFFLCLSVLLSFSLAKLGPDECEVCISVLGKVKQLVPKAQMSNKDIINQKIKEFCYKAKDKENRFCYYIGGTEDAATFILNRLSEPLSKGVPPESVCERTKQIDLQICELKYAALKTEKKPKSEIDAAREKERQKQQEKDAEKAKARAAKREEEAEKRRNTDPYSLEELNKLKVKDLKDVLKRMGSDCKGCTEKSEFIKKILKMHNKEL